MPTDAELDELLTTVRYLKDRQDILDCIVRESNARDRQDVDAINACWWPEGVDEHGAVITGAADYAERANMGHRMMFDATAHSITNHLCEIDGNTANCQSYVVGGLSWKDTTTTTIGIGRYLDRLEKRDGEWRLLVRKCTIEMTSDTDGSWIRSENVKGFLRPRWDGKDPQYDTPYEPGRAGLRW
jgi:hypothetical protein